jgi:hypothetical protein
MDDLLTKPAHAPLQRHHTCLQSCRVLARGVGFGFQADLHGLRDNFLYQFKPII